jgi:hypothetical protein
MPSFFHPPPHQIQSLYSHWIPLRGYDKRSRATSKGVRFLSDLSGSARGTFAHNNLLVVHATAEDPDHFMNHLVEPDGGALVDLMANEERKAVLDNLSLQRF